MTPINGIDPGIIKQLNQLTQHGLQPELNPTTDAAPFKQFFIESIDHVNDMQHAANTAIETLTTGGDINPAEVMTAVQKADMTFRLMQQIRNKLVQAYEEIKQIQI